MKVYLDKNTNYQIGYSSFNGKESLDSLDSEPIIVENIEEYTQKVKNDVYLQIKDFIESHSYTVPVNAKNRKVIYKIGLIRLLNKITGE